MHYKKKEQPAVHASSEYPDRLDTESEDPGKSCQRLWLYFKEPILFHIVFVLYTPILKPSVSILTTLYIVCMSVMLQNLYAIFTHSSKYAELIQTNRIVYETTQWGCCIYLVLAITVQKKLKSGVLLLFSSPFITVAYDVVTIDFAVDTASSQIFFYLLQ